MEDIADIRSLPLSSLTITTRRLLSDRMNPLKVLRTHGPIRRHRDWRGFASLVDISSEVEANIWHYNDKTEKVLEIWMQRRTVLVGELLEHLVTLDRHDVYEDIVTSIRTERAHVLANQVALPHANNSDNSNNTTGNSHNAFGIYDKDLITFEDRPGHKHIYDAYILYAEEDRGFVMQMKSFLNSHGFETCMKDNLLPGYASQYPPVARLISERCKRIILVFSPDFLRSNDNSFFRDFAQAFSIEMNRSLLIPIIYRVCQLPMHLRLYCSLYFNSEFNNFWDRLVKSLDNTRRLGPPPAASSQSSSHSAVNIVTASDQTEDDSRYFLPNTSRINFLTPTNVSLAPSTVSLATSTVSLPDIPSSSLSSTLPEKKKKGILRKLFAKKKSTVPCV